MYIIIIMYILLCTYVYMYILWRDACHKDIGYLSCNFPESDRNFEISIWHDSNRYFVSAFLLLCMASEKKSELFCPLTIQEKRIIFFPYLHRAFIRLSSSFSSASAREAHESFYLRSGYNYIIYIIYVYLYEKTFINIQN